MIEHDRSTNFSTKTLSFVILAVLYQAITPINVSADWKSYNNRDFGFTVQYAKDFTLCAGGFDYCEISSSSYIPVCSDDVVDCFVYTGQKYKGTNFQGEALSVNVLRDRRSEQDCDKFGLGPHPIKTKTINGVRFHYEMAGEAGLGNWGGGAIYRAFYDNVCFELAANVSGADFDDFDPGTIKEFDRANLDKELDAMVDTFRFTGPVADGPAWRVYRNAEVGGTFEYPDRDTVVKFIEYSSKRQSSNEITDSVYFSEDGLNYFVAAKADLKDKDALNTWLKSSGYPNLDKAQELRHSKLFTEYKAGNYWYVYGQTMLYILGASDQGHNAVAPPDNAVFRHFLHSFRPSI